jgi:hypothetical protein
LPDHPAHHDHTQPAQPAQPAGHDDAAPSGAGDGAAAARADRDVDAAVSVSAGRRREPAETGPGRAESTETAGSAGLVGLSRRSRPGTRTGAEPAGAELPGTVIPLPRQPADAGPVAGPARAESGASDGGWQVSRVDTAPMSGEEFTAAVNALAALITEWNQRPTDSSENTRAAA